MLKNDWGDYLNEEFEKPYLKAFYAFLAQEQQKGKIIYPPQSQWLRALGDLNFADVKVVILGQDPYHGQGQAEGLSFSVPQGIKIPPSLRNIFKEITADLNEGFIHGSLEAWMAQGVLLLNSVLTVEEGQAGSHANKGWEQFTDRIIEILSQEKSHLVFMLWGSYAQKKGEIIDSNKHLVLKAPHPSPLSAYRGFLGCQHFSKANQYMKEHHNTFIHWYN